MKRQDFTFDETKLNLTFDENGDAVWSFKAVKEGVKCRKVRIKFLPLCKRKYNRNEFSREKIPIFSIARRIAYSFMPRRVKNALIDVLHRPVFEERHNVSRYHIQYHNIVQGFAKKGFLDRHFHRKVIKLSKLFGFKPRHFDLHHNTPISWGGKNDSENITLIHYKLHRRLHKLTTDLVTKAAEENKSKLYMCEQYVMMPVLPPVLTKKNIADYFNGFDDLLLPSQEKTVPQQLPNEKKHVQDTIQTSKQNTLETPSVKAQLKKQLQSLSTVDQNKKTKNKSGKRKHKKLNEMWYSAVFKQRGRNAS